MRKFFVIILSLLIVILSFAVCFADSGGPVIVPVSDGGSSGIPIELSNDTTHVYSSNNSPVYITWSTINGRTSFVAFSEFPNTVVYNEYNGNVTTLSLNNQYNGYYYSNNVSTLPKNVGYITDGSYSLTTDLIDYIDSTVFSTAFDLTYIIDGSVIWLSNLAQAVKNNSLLLFFVLFIFVGIGIGLLNRFSRR